jgi:phosphoribosylaminoimidazole-succinocarboxamide synthase
VEDPQKSLFESDIKGLSLQQRGKVRDMYEVDAQHLLIVTSDRISAFDVVLPTPVPGKGAVLTTLSNFWFERTRDLVPNHLQLARRDLADIIAGDSARAELETRAVVVRKMKPLPIEAIVRGYIIGSGWKDYQQDGAVCGIPLPAGLRLADRLETPIFTPSSKAAVGTHDENITMEEMTNRIGEQRTQQVRDISLALYRRARDYAADRGIIIADTKFEFGVDEEERLVLIDEVLTPDSSRFWPADAWKPGQNPPSFDKQFVRDYLQSLTWDKRPPAPDLPEDIIAKTAAKYREAQRRLMG